MVNRKLADANKKGDGQAIAFFFKLVLSYKRLSELYQL